MKDRYRALRVVIAVLRMLAWIVVIFGGLIVVGAAITTTAEVGGTPQGWLRAMAILVGGIVALGLQALALFAACALITLLIDIERNTRAATEMIAYLTRLTEARADPAEMMLPPPVA